MLSRFEKEDEGNGGEEREISVDRSWAYSAPLTEGEGALPAPFMRN